MTGTVVEFVPRRSPAALPLTELVRANLTVLTSGGGHPVDSIPAFAPPRTLSAAGSYPPPPGRGAAVDLTAGAGGAACAGDASDDALCYFERAESMLVSVVGAVAATSELAYGELGVVGGRPGGRPGGSPTNAAGGLAAVTATDWRGELLLVDGGLVRLPTGGRNTTMGQRLRPFRALVSYGFGSYRLYNTEPLVAAPPAVPPLEAVCRGGCAARRGPRRTAAAAPPPPPLRVASYNIENKVADDGTLARVGEVIGTRLGCPHVVGLQEVGTTAGAGADGTASAAATLAALVASANRACGAAGTAYAAAEVAPVAGADGGKPGLDIRVAVLYDTSALTLERRAPPGGAAAAAVTATAYRPDLGGLTVNPGRVAPTLAAFRRSRKPLAVQFGLTGPLAAAPAGAPPRRVFVLVNHWNSKGGDAPLAGALRPPPQPSQVQRRAQAAAVAAFVRTLPPGDPVFVVGDLNDFWFSSPVTALAAGGGLTNLWSALPTADRYSYAYQGRLQTLDHVLVRPAALADACCLCSPHTTTGGGVGSRLAVSDHDPIVASCTL